MKLARDRFGAILIFVLALSLSGCGDSSLGPDRGSGNTGGNDPGAQPAGPEILMITEDRARFVRLSSADGGNVETARALHVSAVVDGAVGGNLQCGRFLLSIPPGAFEGEGTISMSMPDSTVMVVDLEIDPVGLNDFKKPVKLCLLTEGTRLSTDDIQIYWWDEDYSEWKSLFCDKDLSDDTTVIGASEGLLTDLDHFSRYSGGKAGW
ncbi:MAG TPA: hypothetical protein VFP58_01475 [Candidatus Eisenbacteria bacterium]|nr:hypothetical protein [Candidatus Eisenbacteria bacterium]